jgi:RNA polymerase sigma-70 factor (ECF subfamily)
MPTVIRTVTFAGLRHPASGESLSDEAVLTRIARGDKIAMRILFARHQVRIYRFALRILRDEARAEDVVSEVFVHAWRQAAKFEGRSTVSTWLVSIARHIAISELRRRTEAEWDNALASSLVDPADDPASTTEKKKMGSLLQTSLMKLSRAHREVIDLVYYHEKSVDEVAEIIGIPPGTVKTRMFYARNQLRQLLNMAGIHTAA